MRLFLNSKENKATIKIYFRLELLRSSFIPFFYGPTEQQNK